MGAATADDLAFLHITTVLYTSPREGYWDKTGMRLAAPPGAITSKVLKRVVPFCTTDQDECIVH